MTGRATNRQPIRQLLTRLEGDACPYCPGTLVRGRYADTEAVVCDDCGTPAVRLWDRPAGDGAG